MPDYGNISLREELEARFKEAEQREQEAEFLSRGWRPPAQSEVRTPWDNVWQSHNMGYEEEREASGATSGADNWDIVQEGIKGFGRGVVSGSGRFANGATLGFTDWLDRNYNDGRLSSFDEDLQRSAEAEGLGGAVKGAGFVSELGGNMLGAGGALIKGGAKLGLKGLKLASTAGGIEGAAYGLTGSDSLDEVLPNMAVGAVKGAAVPVGLHYGAMGTKWAARPLTDKVTHYLGKRNLAKQLAKTDGYEGVNLGNVDDDLATRINQVRNAENVFPLDNSRVSITGERVGHIRDGRIVKDGHSPEFMADVVDNALFGKNLRVIKGNVPENQVVFDYSNPANKVVVSRNNDTSGISVITAMKDKTLGKINKRLGGLPFPPYGASTTSGTSTAAGSFKIPDFQPLNINNILQNTEKVNPAWLR